jgi:hypothetical protein
METIPKFPEATQIVLLVSKTPQCGPVNRRVKLSQILKYYFIGD